MELEKPHEAAVWFDERLNFRKYINEKAYVGGVIKSNFKLLTESTFCHILS